MPKLAKGIKVGVMISSTLTNFSQMNGTVTLVTPTVTEIETTTLDDDAKSFIPGLIDNGSISFDFYYTETDLHDLTTPMGYCLSQQSSGETDAFTLTYPDGTKQTFSGFLKSWSPTGSLDGLLTGKAEIRISGAVTTTAAS